MSPSSNDPEVRAAMKACLAVVSQTEPLLADLWQAAGLTLTQLVVLRRLRHGPQPTGKLAAAAGLSPASASRLLDRLEERGLVARRRALEDRRSIEVHLTPEGERLQGGVHLLRGSAIRRAVEGMTSDERQRLIASLERLLEGVRQLNDEPRTAAMR